MAEMIGYCGFRCDLCAARSDDPAIRQQLVDGWRRIWGHQNYTAENVRCEGCRGNGLLADKECRARPCAIERGVENCVFCSDFVCDKVRHLLASREGFFIFLHQKLGSLTEEEYNLCVRQFMCMPYLVELLVQAGKLPAWVMETGNETRS